MVQINFRAPASTSVETKMVEVGLAEGPWSLTDHGRRAEMKLRTNQYDLEAWSVLVREAQVSFNVQLSHINA